MLTKSEQSIIVPWLMWRAIYHITYGEVFAAIASISGSVRATLETGRLIHLGRKRGVLVLTWVSIETDFPHAARRHGGTWTPAYTLAPQYRRKPQASRVMRWPYMHEVLRLYQAGSLLWGGAAPPVIHEPTDAHGPDPRQWDTQETDQPHEPGRLSE